jgi:hypothetical protein
MKGLVLHCGANEATREDIALVETPEATESWTPIPHRALIDITAENLERSGYQIVAERHGLNREGRHYFGLLELRNGSNHEDRALTVGLRNSHDKAWAAGMVVGSRVFVCDNLAFSGEIKIARMHTRRIMDDLPRMVEAAMGRLTEARQLQDKRIDAYKGRELGNLEFHDMLVQALDCKAAVATTLPKILESWRNPEHPEFKDRTLWSAFNAFTQNMKDLRMAEVSRRTLTLHGIFDGRAGLHRGGDLLSQLGSEDGFRVEAAAFALN